MCAINSSIIVNNILYAMICEILPILAPLSVARPRSVHHPPSYLDGFAHEPPQSPSSEHGSGRLPGCSCPPSFQWGGWGLLSRSSAGGWPSPSPVVLRVLPLRGSPAPIGYIYDASPEADGGLLAAASAFFSHQGHQVFHDPCLNLAAHCRPSLRD